jgi:hypothetical protein
MTRASLSRLVVLLAAVVTGGLASPPAAAADPARPFSGTATGEVTGVGPSGELVVTYTGTATHLGKFTREERLFLNPDGTFTGTMVFTAADDDELWVEFAGGFVSPTTAEGTYTFVGGTGRFEGATGSAGFEAVTPDGIQVTAAFEGTLTY